MRLPPPAEWSMSIEFADGHVVYVPELDPSATSDDLAAAGLALIGENVEHGAPVMILPNSGRFLMVSPEKAADLHAQGVRTVNTSGMSYEEAMRAAGLE